MKKLLILLILLSNSVWAQDLVLNGCAYSGDVAQGKPHGNGKLSCQNGMIYEGKFSRGEFDGQGKFIVPNQHSINLSPFGLNSDKLRGMTLVGKFAHGIANGKFKIYQDGKHVFNFTFQNGIATDMQLAK